MLHLYGERVLPFDVTVARLTGELTDKAHAAGHAPGFADVAIAAPAGRHGMTILTRNLRHFTPLDIQAIDPFATLPRPRGLGETHGALAASQPDGAFVQHLLHVQNKAQR